jgi:DNA-binding transcriptional ArsR family regulator
MAAPSVYLQVRPMTTAHDDPFLQAMNEVFPVEAPRTFQVVPSVPPEQRDEAWAGRARAWAHKALQGRCERLAQTPADTDRNEYLNKSAWVLYRYALAGHLDAEQVTEQLRYAAVESQLGTGEVEATLVSAHRGATKPENGPLDPPVDGGADPFDGVLVDPVTGEVQGQYVPRPLPAMDLALLGERCPPLDWLVEGRMTRQSLTILGSKPGIGKSWTALDLSLALTMGRPWLGHSVPRVGKVLYIDVENGEVLARRRLQQLGADVEGIGGRLHYVTEAVIFPGGDDSRRYRDTLETFQPDLVVVDTLASSAPSAEKDTEAASLFLSDIWHKARDAGAAVLILAHLRKSQQGAGKDDPLDSFRGAGHLSGAASRAWLLEPRGQGAFVLRDVKDREYPALPPTRIALVDREAPPDAVVDKFTSVVMDGVEEEETAESGLLRFQRNVLTFIDNHPNGMAKTADLLTLGDGETARTLSNHLTKMYAAGIVDRPRKGFYSRASSKGLPTVEEG